MMSPNAFSGEEVCLTARDLALSFDNGVQLFANLSFTIAQQKVGLVGRNGIGKSQLLKMLTGEVRASQGQIRLHGGIGYLPQHFAHQPDALIADVLHVRQKIEALRAIEAGAADARFFDVLGDDWDIEARLHQLLTEIGLAKLDVDRPFASLSGGEATRVYLAGLMLQRPKLLLLDEPTNNLDMASRQALYRVLSSWRGGLLVVSHDRTLLNLMDRIMELSTLGLKQFEGNYDHYANQKAVEEDALQRNLKHARTTLKKTRQAAQKSQEKLQQRQAQGRRERGTGSQPKTVVNARKERSEGTASGLKKTAERQMTQQRQMLDDARKQVEALETIDVSMVAGKVPASKMVLEIRDLNFAYPGSDQPLLRNVNLKVSGPQRIWLKGANGCGKTSLMKLIQQAAHNPLPKASDPIRLGVKRVVYLDQHVRVLDPEKSIFDNFCTFQPDMQESEVRGRLARFLFRGDCVFKPVKQLSGGERLRAALACLFMHPDAPQLLLLDEPTNHLDLHAVAALEAILNQYQGALLVISHDAAFIKNIRIDRTLALG